MTVPAPGTIIGRYKVESSIGSGSMGDVIKAVDIDLKRKVALKILSEKHRHEEELEKRFIREGRAVAAISHANVVQVFTTGTYDNRPYIAMEFLTGTDLKELIKVHGPLTSLKAAQAILDSAKGLEAAAKAGLIHRDVKPANLVMLNSGSVKVTDFGLAKPVAGDEPALTALGVVVGTPDYIAPEQARGETITQSVDIYALGGTLYYLLIGKPPFRLGNAHDDKYLKVVARHLQEPAPNPLLINSDINGKLARLQLQMMSKKASSRPDYPRLIAELQLIIAELTTPKPSQSQDSKDAVTPAIGGDRNNATRKISPAPKTQRESTALVSHEVSGSTSQHQDFGSPPKRSKALRLFTLFSTILFLAALGLYFFGPLPEKSSSTAMVATIDAGATTPDNVVDATPPKAIQAFVPKGMFLVPANDRAPSFLIAIAPVQVRDFSELFPRIRKPNTKKSVHSITGLSYAQAQAYARTKSASIPTASQWERALSFKKELQWPLRWEWLSQEVKDKPSMQWIAGREGKKAKRFAAKGKEVGFRLVFPVEAKISD